MKNTLLLMSFIAVAAITVSCNKNKKVQQNLVGTWDATKYEVSEGGLTIDLIAGGGEAQYILEDCAGSPDTYCPITVTVSGEIFTIPINETATSTYKVINDGKTISVLDSLGSTDNISILQHDGDFLRVQDINGAQTITVELQKQ